MVYNIFYLYRVHKDYVAAGSTNGLTVPPIPNKGDELALEFGKRIVSGTVTKREFVIGPNYTNVNIYFEEA